HQALGKIGLCAVLEIGVGHALPHIRSGLRALALGPLRLFRGWRVAWTAVVIGSAAGVTQRVLLAVRATQALAIFDVSHGSSPSVRKRARGIGGSSRMRLCRGRRAR